MQQISVLIKDKKDAGSPAWPDMTKDNSVEGKFQSVCILEKGTEGGQAAIGFRMVLPDGSFAIAQMTANMLKGIHGALCGAEMRWLDEHIAKQ